LVHTPSCFSHATTISYPVAYQNLDYAAYELNQSEFDHELNCEVPNQILIFSVSENQPLLIGLQILIATDPAASGESVRNQSTNSKQDQEHNEMQIDDESACDVNE
jgi:hypothetical protein